jgi:hypothetical protein
MFGKKNQPAASEIPSNILLSAGQQAPHFYRINIEYFCLYYSVQNNTAKQALFRGLTNNHIGSSIDLRRKATEWKQEHKSILEDLVSELYLDLKRLQRQMPTVALRCFPLDIESLQKIISKTPNDHLCHFHLGWLYSITDENILAERHFNIAALQSQNVNPDFACFAYRHLANTRVKNGKLAQGVLAIEAACTQSQHYNPELQFERVSLLSRSNKTTQALPYLANLIKKAPHYAILASQDLQMLNNPSLNRFFMQEKEKHIAKIKQQVVQHWKNDPLHLLNLDKELGQKNSRKIIIDKQAELLSRLPPLLIFNETVSSQLIQKSSRSIIIRSLNKRKQQYIKKIEQHQERANKAHSTGQWMVYIAIIVLISLGLSYAVSSIAYQFGYQLPVNLLVQSVVLSLALGLAVIGFILLHFTPSKLTDLLRQKQRLETLSLRLGLTSG